MGVMTTKFLGKFGEIVFILRNAFIYRGLRKFLGDCYTLSPIIFMYKTWRALITLQGFYSSTICSSTVKASVISAFPASSIC